MSPAETCELLRVLARRAETDPHSHALLLILTQETADAPPDARHTVWLKTQELQLLETLLSEMPPAHVAGRPAPGWFHAAIQHARIHAIATKDSANDATTAGT